MRVLWTLLKVIITLAVAIPLGLLALALTVGVVGTLLGLAIAALKLACIAGAAYGLYRVARHVIAHAPNPQRVRELPPPADPYYTAAMRELDSELGTRSR